MKAMKKFREFDYNKPSEYPDNQRQAVATLKVRSRRVARARFKRELIKELDHAS